MRRNYTSAVGCCCCCSTLRCYPSSSAQFEADTEVGIEAVAVAAAAMAAGDLLLFRLFRLVLSGTAFFWRRRDGCCEADVQGVLKSCLDWMEGFDDSPKKNPARFPTAAAEARHQSCFGGIPTALSKVELLQDADAKEATPPLACPLQQRDTSLRRKYPHGLLWCVRFACTSRLWHRAFGAQQGSSREAAVCTPTLSNFSLVRLHSNTRGIRVTGLQNLKKKWGILSNSNSHSSKKSGTIVPQTVFSDPLDFFIFYFLCFRKSRLRETKSRTTTSFATISWWYKNKKRERNRMGFISVPSVTTCSKNEVLI